MTFKLLSLHVSGTQSEPIFDVFFALPVLYFCAGMMEAVRTKRRFAPQGWLGFSLLAVCWPLNWTLPGTRTAYLFFPLWLGYILAVDACVARRRGASLWTRSPRDFGRLFVLSTPAWWLFELINDRTHNWEYLGAGGFTPLEYYALCTLAFSTVMPAVFETAELVRTFRWVDSLRPAARIPDTPRVNRQLFLAGLTMLTLTLLWPKFFYPLVWISLVLVLEPLNHRLGRRHLLEWLARGDWRPIVSLSLGALICGFFWEMWNYWSWPQWIYHTPGADFLHLFEMPLLGYGGYIPFALELFALKNFLWSGGPQLAL
ncbi:MAG TPA: hypothetical protein VFB55_10915 [Verrucomicrobiae bacterium]|nr:hypothetical protein [Verrucomicrobiae bacterium]